MEGYPKYKHPGTHISRNMVTRVPIFPEIWVPWIPNFGDTHIYLTPGQAVEAENLEGKAVKGTSQIRKSQGSSTVKGQPDTKSHQSTISHLVEQVSQGSKDYLSGGQAIKAKNSRSKCLTAVAGVSTESIGVTSPCSRQGLL